ncbi:DUF5946 family protein [Microbispora sp. NPDC046933]|uniref:DUF5946 family protein n=1 Tax=Microbispora sp. NPDC046933 TaxID=3155618 RepID=UPI0033DE4D6D
MVRTMTDGPGMDRCDCGATTGPLGGCVDYYHAILAEEQTDPQMYRWHTPVVCAYLLQHPSRAHGKYLDGQFRLLQLYVDKGLDALLRVAAHQVARNRHGARSSYDMAPLAEYAPLPQGGSPGPFRAAFCGLPTRDGSFVADGHPAYGRRIEIIAEATVEAWRSLKT